MDFWLGYIIGIILGYTACLVTIFVEEKTRKYITEIQNALNQNCTGLTLDIASGIGRFTALEAQEIIRADFDLNVKPNVVCDIRFLPFRKATFDSLYCIQTIGAFEGSEKALKELNRILKLNSKLVLTLLRKYSLYRLQPFRNNKGKERFSSTKELPFEVLSTKSIDAIFPFLKNEFLLICRVF